MKKDMFLVMVFYSTTDTIKTEKELGQQFKTMIIPTPREISKSCGFAIRFYSGDEDELAEASAKVQVPHALYCIAAESEPGKRTARLIEGIIQ